MHPCRLGSGGNKVRAYHPPVGRGHGPRGRTLRA